MDTIYHHLSYTTSQHFPEPRDLQAFSPKKPQVQFEHSNSYWDERFKMMVENGRKNDLLTKEPWKTISPE